MLKNLKSLFITDDESDKKKEPIEKKKESSQEQTKEKQVSSLENQKKTIAGEIDSEIIEKLLQAIEKNNLEGFDYLEFKKALKALEKIPMEEATKYRSTFATASTMGVTLDKLIDSTAHYIKVLDSENNTFLKAFEKQLISKVGNKEKEISQFESIIGEKSEKIKQLTEEIAKHQSQIIELRKTVDESKMKIDKTKNDFRLSHLHLRTQLEQDIEKMKQYLK
ncbi:hypothetical protein [Tenacibaculum caenipelagi]|nr:hypothetical protein [Tenacibaculum caenipelagi]